jgi:uncharacterized protein (TIGR03437 family)
MSFAAVRFGTRPSNRSLTVAFLTLLLAPMVSAQSAVWTAQSPGSAPSARSGHAMAYDSVHSQTVLFSGDSNNNWVDDTWLWDGANWTQALPQSVPPARTNGALVFDVAQGQAVLFGGVNVNGNFFNDTWAWDGTNWTQESPQTSPAARALFGITYDSVHGQVVLFGGEDANDNTLSDTWVWNGSNWIQQFPQTSPPARFGYFMTFDSVHRQVVLFGGFTATGTLLDDTWVWNGVNWTLVSPQTAPLSRADGGMVFDTKQGQAVLFGGLAANYAFGDTWLWNGTNWTQQAPPTSPPARFKQTMAFDSVNNVTVLFGGRGQENNFLGDTWTYGVPASVTPPPVVGPVINQVLSASDFGAFTSVAPGSWVEIYGTDLAPETSGWTSSEFTGNIAPTTLSGVSVSFGGQAAFLDYVSATQVNAQLPSNISTGGTLQLTVTNGTTSAPVNVTVNPAEPGLLAPASFQVGANQYVVAQHADGTYVLPAGAISGVASSPAQPGETIVIYGVGFGSVTPNIPAGEIATQADKLSASFEILYGKTPAKLAYFGLAPNFVGLYQFDVTVPTVADSDLVPLTFNLGGVPGTQTLFTAVHQ